jgi:hypothetical protein
LTTTSAWIRSSSPELPGIEGGVGDGEGARELGVEAWFAAQRLCDRNLLHWDPGRTTALAENIAECGVIRRGRDEQTAGVLDAVGGNPPEDDVLDDAFLGRLRVLDRVASSRVE